jgi:hypothetical protein
MNLLSKTAIALITMALSSFSNYSKAQVKKQRTCATMTAIEEQLKSDPVFRADYEAKHKNIDKYLEQYPIFSTEAFPNNGDTVIIPVVVHIVLPDPYRVTDENVQFFIDRINEDFSGFNADSTNASNFYGVRGHSLMRFTLARRDPNGRSTTGIERKVGNIQIAGTLAQNLKNPSAGGLAAWNINNYYNLWVGSGYATTGLLGISPQIGPGGTGGTSADGVCVDEMVFANNPCYTDGDFSLARTAVHEIGHNMGLYHTFNGGCSTTNTDFSANLTTPGRALPAALLLPIDDTPPLSGQTNGCPGMGTLNGCNPSVEKMFQNYMDYSNDPCLTLFTNGQVRRMHHVVQNFRSGYLTTQGHLPPAGTPVNEAGMFNLVSPGGIENIGCNNFTYSTPTCGNGAFVPKFRIANYGIANLNTITLGILVNGVQGVTQTFTLSGLKPGKSTVLTLPTQTLNTGVNIVKFYTANPNGILDSVNTNDTITQTITITNPPVAPTALPLNEGFEDGTFGPTVNGWNVLNNDNGITWERNTSASRTGSASASINMFNYTSTGQLDCLHSPRLNFANNQNDSVFVSFNYAYRLKANQTSARRDSLSLEVTTDCNPAFATWTTLWKRGGDALRTNTTATNTNWIPTAGQWTTTPIRVSLWDYKNTPIYVALRTRNGNGQNIYVDDVNIFATPAPLPLKLISFTASQTTTSIICKWETSTEIDTKNFNIERSYDGRNFVSIGVVNAMGNTNSISFYQYADEEVYKSRESIVYYRLKMNDLNGKYSYSQVVALKLGEKQTVQIFPNPTKQNLNVQITNSINSAVNSTVEVLDYLGRVVINKNIKVILGTQNVELNTAALVNGNYIVVIKTDNDVKTFKFIKN